jgi:hypothetical protein
MKSEIVKIEAPNSKQPNYPYLGRFNDGRRVVLFTKNNTGTVIAATPASSFIVGHFGDAWDESAYIPLPPGEAVQLSN